MKATVERINMTDLSRGLKSIVNDVHWRNKHYIVTRHNDAVAMIVPLTVGEAIADVNESEQGGN